ncbi:glycosyltransferase [Dehalogenimonas sp. 4OHTPN]|uniref:Glycosyltransferase n=1 Tax=Dehalogenimonas sp. 4OHTPN TaxID=3166643 RepID=A0AAU8G828_9CHLR
MKTTADRTVIHLIDHPSALDLKLLERLADLGWNVHLVYRRTGSDRLINSGLKIITHRLPLTTRYPWVYLAFIAAVPIIYPIKSDIIHAHYLTGFGILAAVYRRFLRFKRMVLTVPGPDVLIEASRGMVKWSAEHALKMFEIVTFPSESVAAHLKELRVPSNRMLRLDWAGSEKEIEAAAAALAQRYAELIGPFER